MTSQSASFADGPMGPKLVHLPPALLPYRQTMCSYTAALVATAAAFPLDSVKTRLQTHKFDSTWHCIVDTKRSEGIKGFYRGLTAPLLSSSFVRSVSVTVYAKSTPFFSRIWESVYDKPQARDNTVDWILRTTPVSFSAGALAGTVCSTIACPFEFTKLASQIELLVKRSQLADPTAALSIKPKGTFQIARELMASGGPLAVYGGYRYHLLRDFFGSGVYFMVYENFKTLSNAFFHSESPHPVSIALSGAMAGSVCWTVVYPFDTYKSMVQRDIYARMIRARTGAAPLPVNAPGKLFSIFHARMYRGLGMSIARTSLIGMIFFSCYEQFIRLV